MKIKMMSIIASIILICMCSNLAGCSENNNNSQQTQESIVGISTESNDIPNQTTGSQLISTNIQGNHLVLWEHDGWKYWIEPRIGESNIPGNGVARLFRAYNNENEEMLNDLVKLSFNQQGLPEYLVLPAEDRIIFIGYTGTAVMDFKTKTIISIREDGSDRKILVPDEQTANMICIDNGSIFYEGWSNDRSFPRPIYGHSLELSEKGVVAKIDGTFICVFNNYIYYVGKGGENIYKQGIVENVKPELYDKVMLSPDLGPITRISDKFYDITFAVDLDPYHLIIK